ncbi:MAG TPA: chaperonin family protein RbcX [Leptolyngbyaceae cyanobacterium M65_K2018_010]|nr:chaperonin family protein RbcX [Leptolyngbyaceae cyanobacterium M65_K2018_010]
MDLKRIAKDTASVLISYLTFQAVKTVLNQLRETDPPQAYWLNAFSTKEALQDGEAYLTALMAERGDLAVRIMTVRQHIAEEVGEFLPEMVLTGIQQANMDHRRRYLERATQLGEADSEAAPLVEAERIQEPMTDADAPLE